MAFIAPPMQAQTATSSYLNLGSYETIGTVPTNSYYLTNYYAYSEDSYNNVAWVNMSVFGAYYASKNSGNTWISYSTDFLTGSLYAWGTWQSNDVFQGGSTYNSSNGYYVQCGNTNAKRTITFYVTNCSEVRLLGKTNSKTTANYPIAINVYKCDANLNPESSVTATDSYYNTTATIFTLTASKLDAVEKYKVEVSIYGGELYEIAFQMPLSGNKYEATASPSSINFGAVNQESGATQTITLSNTGTGDADFTPVPSITDDASGVFSIESGYETGVLEVGDTRDYTIVFNPNAESSFTGNLVFTMTGEDGNERTLTVPLSGTGNKALYAASVTPDEGQLDFGKIIVGRTATKKVTITSLGTQPIAPTVSITGTGFDVDYTTTTLNLNESNEITVTFTPTAANIIYTGRLTITAYDGKTFNFTLKGEGKDESEASNFDNGTYKWPINADEADQVTSYYSEIATDPDQMIALMRAVYMDQTLPGSIKRGYSSAGEVDGTVDYPAIGTMTGSYANPSYNDAYGWNIPSKKSIVETPFSNKELKYFDRTDYTPTEGLTLLLVEVKDGVDASKTGGIVSQSSTDYASLRNIFEKTFSSVRIISSSKELDDATNPGTLFKIDCDRMNRFFLLGKGRLRQYGNYIGTGDNIFYGSYWENGKSSFTEVENGPFYQMFEQFSPVSLTGSSAYATDIYQSLVNGDTYGVEHDCEAIPWANDGNDIIGHEFNLYGRDSYASDCQDIRDLLLFIPKYRMKWWYSSSGGGRDGMPTEEPSTDMYKNYNKDYEPTMGLFVINQNEITGEKVENARKYNLHFRWTSNLAKFLPGANGKYTLYQVVTTTNADGTVTKSYVEVDNAVVDANTLNFDWTNVPMEANGREMTFVVRGQDADGFLTLQYSNERSFYIPGYENKEQLKLAMNIDSYFSRFDPQLVQNNYSNSLTIDNAGTSLLSTYLSDGTDGDATVFHIWRVPNGNYDDKVEVATATVTSKTTSGGTMNLVMVPATQSEFTYGYHANANEMHPTFSINSNGVVTFSNFSFYDNFSEAIPADNTHPSNYVYYVTFTAATPFPTYNPEGIPDIATWQEGKTFAYFECKWGSTMWAHAWNNSGNVTGTWPGQQMTKVGTINRNNEDYNIWLWVADENAQSPTMILFNWDNHTDGEKTQDYTFTNGGYYKHEVSDVAQVSKSSHDATSNTVTIPVYKTAMAMSPINQTAVDEDLLHQAPANTKFTINVQSSARSEILRYDAYRWADSEYGTTENPRTILESGETTQDEEDVDPQGQANNESDHYTTKMNADYTSSVSFANGANSAWAPFEDNFMLQNPSADTYTYAPVVELCPPAGSYYSGTTPRVDYNTYGAPLQAAAGGEMDIVEVEKEASGYTWPVDNPTYRYYNVFLKLNSDKLIVPAGYEIYKVRIWRQINEDYLGEQEGKGYEDRLDLDENGEYLFEDIEACQPGGSLGSTELGTSGNGPVYAGTFGAKIVEGTEVIPMKFTVRVYFTKSSSSKAGDQPYYIAETVVEDELTSDILTSIFGVESYKVVTGIKYYNLAGIESDVPFQGVNIEVTTYEDGSRTTRKILK